MPVVILVPKAFPFDGEFEAPFVGPEVEELARVFRRVIVAPESLKGVASNLPSGVELTTDLARALELGTASKASLVRQALSWRTATEIARVPAIALSARSLVWQAAFVRQAQIVRRWVKRFMLESQLDPSRTVLYSYWFDASSFGLGLARKDCGAGTAVSRAHGYDVYETRRHPAYWPLRSAALAAMDRVFVVSDHGRQHIAERYPEFGGRLRTARLGVAEPGFRTGPSLDGAFRIVSCSFVVPVKRVDLLMAGIARLGRMRPSQRVLWTHLGDGPGLAPLREEAAREMPSNVNWSFPGRVDNRAVLAFYESNPVDAFVNVSSSEGIPVSIMEATSCGIPVIATAAGGTVEIASESNGRLLPVEIDAGQLAEALLEIMMDSSKSASRRNASRRIWAERFSTTVQYSEFARKLMALVEAGGEMEAE